MKVERERENKEKGRKEGNIRCDSMIEKHSKST